MEQKQPTATSKGAKKFQPPAEARGSLTGTFESGKLREKIGKNPPAGEQRGSSHSDVQLGLPGVEVTSGTSNKLTEAPNPDQRNDFTDSLNRSDPYYGHQGGIISGNIARVVGLSCQSIEYPEDTRIVAVQAATTRSLIHVPKQNFMVQAVEFQYDENQDVAPIRVESAVRCFFANMEADVPLELVQM